MCAVTSEGSPAARYRRAYKHGASLAVLTLALRELPSVGVGDALLYVLAHAEEPDGDFAHVAARWLAKLIRETESCTIGHVCRASASLRQLPTYPHVARRDLAEVLDELGHPGAARLLR